jgi:hypothetical protein
MSTYRHIQTTQSTKYTLYILPRLILERVAEASQFFLRDTHILLSSIQKYTYLPTQEYFYANAVKTIIVSDTTSYL